MRKYRIVFALIALLLTQASFANISDMMTTDSDDVTFKQCKDIARACINAGYIKRGVPGKGFWKDCMKPVLLGQTVKGINITSQDAAACRQFKITKMQNELQEFQQVTTPGATTTAPNAPTAP
jgi:hypothetical protein